MRSYWHFCALNDAGKPVMRDGTLVEIGKRYEIDGDPTLCRRGYHGSTRAIDALRYAPGPWVSKRMLEGVVAEGDKVVGRAYVQQPGTDATEVLCKFARMCALDVIEMWEAPEIVARYLRTGDESMRHAAAAAARAAVQARAWDAAWAAVQATARDAPQAVAWAAARDAAWNEAWDMAWTAEKAAAWVTAWGAAERDTAWDTAWDAVRQRQNRRLTRMLNAALKGGEKQ